MTQVITFTILYIIFASGLTMILMKSGFSYIHGLIPIWNIYMLGQTCGSRIQAIVALFTTVFAYNRVSIMIRDFYYVIKYHSPMQITYCIMCIVLIITAVIFTTIVYVNFCEVYQVSHLYVFLWIILPFIAAPLFGFSSKFTPKLQPDEINDVL